MSEKFTDFWKRVPYAYRKNEYFYTRFTEQDLRELGWVKAESVKDLIMKHARCQVMHMRKGNAYSCLDLVLEDLGYAPDANGNPIKDGSGKPKEVKKDV